MYRSVTRTWTAGPGSVVQMAGGATVAPRSRSLKPHQCQWSAPSITVSTKSFLQNRFYLKILSFQLPSTWSAQPHLRPFSIFIRRPAHPRWTVFPTFAARRRVSGTVGRPRNPFSHWWPTFWTWTLWSGWPKTLLSSRLPPIPTIFFPWV